MVVYNRRFRYAQRREQSRQRHPTRIQRARLHGVSTCQKESTRGRESGRRTDYQGSYGARLVSLHLPNPPQETEALMWIRALATLDRPFSQIYSNRTRWLLLTAET